MGILEKSVKNYRINSVSPAVMISEERSPLTADNNFDIGTEWLDSTQNTWYKLSEKPLGVAVWTELGSSASSVTDIQVDASTSPGTNPVVPSASNIITMTGAQVATGTVGANVIRTDSLAANTLTIEIQRSTTAAAADSTLNGVAHFDSSAFTVDSDGFVSLIGGGAGVQSFIPDSGTSPVIPNGSGQVTVTGTNGLSIVGGVNTLTVQSDNGQLATEFLVSSGTSPVVADSSGQITFTDGNGVGMTGGTNEITFDMVSPFTGDFTFTDSTAGDTETLTISNTDNTAANASSAEVSIEVAGTTQTGDPFVNFAVGSTRAYSWGIDTSDSQDLKLTSDAASSVTPSSGTDLMTIDSSGNVTVDGGNLTVNDPGNILCSADRAQDIGSSSNAFDNLYIDGISFDDGSNFLDDYEEGTFTPTFLGNSGSAGSQAYSAQEGSYTKIGNLVTVTFNVAMTDKGSWGSVARIGGMPFDPLEQSSISYRTYVTLRNLTFSSSGIMATITGTSGSFNDSFGLQSEDGSGGAANQNYSDFTNTTQARAIITYEEA